jgi:hypothetical protein
MVNGHGGSRAGSGRPKGTHAGAQLKSRLSPAQQKRAEQAIRLANDGSGTFEGDAYMLLSYVYRCEELPMSLRMRAAETAIAYERPKLTQVEVTRNDDGRTSLLQELKQLMEGTGRGLPSERLRHRLASDLGEDD